MGLVGTLYEASWDLQGMTVPWSIRKSVKAHKVQLAHGANLLTLVAS